MNVTASMALRLIPEHLQSQPVFLCIVDTMVSKFGKKFEDVSKLFDHAAHNGSNYLNGHCFVSIMLCIPVCKNNRVSYLSLPLGYRMWQKKESKLELAASMIRQVMLEFQEKKQLKNSDKVKKYISVTRTEVKYRNENGSWVQDVREYPKTEAGI